VIFFFIVQGQLKPMFMFETIDLVAILRLASCGNISNVGSIQETSLPGKLKLPDDRNL